MKKILFIDLFCEFGHNNINKIYIHKFLESGYEVHIAMKKSYFETLKIDKKIFHLELPERYFKNNDSKILNRFNQVRLLWFILNKTTSLEYSFYFFSYFDEIAFYISRFKRKSYLMVHGNTESLFSPVKYFFLKRLSRFNEIKFLVFLESFKQVFNTKGIHNVLVSSHGLPKFQNTELENEKYYFNDIINNINCSYKQPKIIFIPNANKFGDTSINSLIYHKPFIDLIEKKNIIIILKCNPIFEALNRFFYLPPFVDDNRFKALLSNSDVVLLNYPTSFQFRVSGLFFECMTYNVPLVVPKIASFVQYSENFNYDPFYSNIDELVSSIDFLTSVKFNFFPYKDLKNIEPSIKEIL